MSRGELTRLVINVPPGAMKSLTCSVFWLPWWWTREPWIRAIHASYAAPLAQRDSRKTVDLLQSTGYRTRSMAWHREMIARRYRVPVDRIDRPLAYRKMTESRIENEFGGVRIATSVGGVGTGERAHVVVHDDLVRANDAYSEAAQKAAIAHIEAMSTRGIVGQPFRELLIMQRLHESDPAGHLLAQDFGFEHLCLPAEFEPKRRCVTSVRGRVWQGEDPRTMPGEPLWPAMHTPEELATKKVRLGTYGYAAQYQQAPAPAGGGIFKATWWRKYRRSEAPKFVRVLHSWDTAFKKGEENDYCANTIWGETEDRRAYLLHAAWKKMEYPELKRSVQADLVFYPANAVLIEDKASGQSLLQELRRDTTIPLRPVEPVGDKIQRAHAITPMIEAGMVYVPEDAEWLDEFLQFFTLFPNADHDDPVDSTTQALRYMIHGAGGYGIMDFVQTALEQRRAEDARAVAESGGVISITPGPRAAEESPSSAISAIIAANT